MSTPIINAQMDAINGSMAILKSDLTTLRPLIKSLKETALNAYATESLSNQAIASFTDGANNVPVKSLSVGIEPVQIGTGDPSPTNVRPIIGWNKAQILQSQLAEISAANGRIIFPWKDGNTNYNPEMNLCSVSDEELEGGTSVHGAFFEWDKTIPFGVPFDEPEAICYFDGTEGAGTFNIGIGMAYGTGWSTSKHIQFTLNVAPSNGDQLVINCGTNAANDPTNGRTWNLYAKGSTTSKDTGTTSNGTSGTNLGSTDSTSVGKANGKINAPQRAVYGYNRWSESLLRQYLNATSASGWYAAQNPWDRPNTTAVAREGFLYGYGADVYKYFKPIKVVTVACNADNNAEDVTYDRVFLSSLEQMYCVPQFSGKEGSYWEYYKRLLGRTTPAAQGSTYPRLIKYALNAPTSAQNCWRRSANSNSAATAWFVGTSGLVYTNYASYAYRCAPSVFISAEDIKITDITWQDTVGTVYGGTLNVLTGVLVVDKGVKSFDGSETWTKNTYTDGKSYFAYKLGAFGFVVNDVGISSHYVRATITSTTTGIGFNVYNSPSNNDARVAVRPDLSQITTAAEMETWCGTQYTNGTPFTVVYELATPTTVQLTPTEVKTLLGVNNIWADTGDITEITIRCDTALYLQKLVG